MSKPRFAWFRLIAAVVLCLGITSCLRPGGGSAWHTPPSIIEYGQPTILAVKLGSWGGGSGKLSSRYTNVECHYRLKGSEEFKTIPFVIKRETDDYLWMECELPALQPEEGATDDSYVEYYIGLYMDGSYSQRPQVAPRIPLRPRGEVSR